MIDFIGIRKQFGTQVVLDDVSLRINSGEHVAVVGPNGAGKSTLFGLVSGELEPDAGEVCLPRNVRFGYLHQQLNAHAVDVTLRDYTANAMPELRQIETEIHALEHQARNTEGRERERLLHRAGELQHTFEHLDGYTMLSRAEAALGGLGFRNEELDKPFRSFSGGWQMRAELARTLIAQPDILLLDEPSNYLDLPAVEWLQRFLRAFAGTMLLISHDRYLLRTLTDRTVEVSGGGVVRYEGGYDYYTVERQRRWDQQMAAYRNYVERRDAIETFVRRFRAKATKAAQAQSRLKLLEKLEEVKAPPAPPDLSRLRIAEPPHCGARVLSLQQAGFTYDGQRWIFRNVDLDIHRGEKVAVVGYNGLGKTTLLRVLASALTLKEGTRTEGHQVVVGYQSQDFAETMPPEQSVYQIVKAANPARTERDVRTLLGSFGFSGSSAEKLCSVLSGGEKIRLAFARIFIRPPNLLILDEPTTHLDIHGREALEEAIRAYKGAVCLVSHDVTFVRNTAQRIVAMAPPGIACFAGGYDYYLEKTAGQPMAGMAAAQLKQAPTTEAKAEDQETGAPLRGKEARRQRALEREATRGLRKLEKEMEQLEAERAELHVKLASGSPELDYAALGVRLSEVNARIGKVETAWLREAEALERA